ncbi:MAG: hypothetical protein FWH48_04605 [Oscillospiraceae bacterium]|nr:hypothetical protein [Oscillospiraceae bacterium]
MKNLKKLLFALIVLAMLAPAALISCNSKEAGPASTTEVGAEKPVEESAQDEKYSSNLPAHDFGGREITLLVSSDTWGGKDINAEESSDDSVVDSVYIRNRNIEERYNFTIKTIDRPNEEVAQMSMRDVLAGLRTFDVAFMNMMKAGANAPSGVFCNLFDIPNIDFNKYYWDQSAKTDLSIGDALYYTVSDIDTGCIKGTFLMLYNKKVAEDMAIESLYDLVFGGSWTIDKFSSMMRDISRDLDGDGVFGERDFYGFATQDEMNLAFIYGGGERFVDKNEYNIPKFRPASERMYNIADKLDEIMRQNNSSINSHDFQEIYTDGIWRSHVAFMEDRALFYGGLTASLEEFKGMESPFGVLPMPKYDERQEYYHTYVYVGAPVLSVPNNLGDEDLFFTGFVLEAMAAESRKLLVPAYYETAMKIKYARDDESSQILDMIFEHRSYDISYINNFGGFWGGIWGKFREKTFNMASYYESTGPAAEAALEAYVNSF